MSMMGEFVQVTPELLAEVLRNPSLVTELVGSQDAAGQPMTVNTTTLDQWQRRMPRMLAGALAGFDPATQEALTKRLGVSVESLGSGAGGQEIVNWMVTRGTVRVAGSESKRAPLQGKGATLSLEKSWHGIHYLLCGEVEPGSSIPSQAVLGGSEFGEDLGYGPARYFTVDQVVQISRELSRPELETEMSARFAPSRMSELGIYPQRWRASDVTWLLEVFDQLRKFYREASSQHLAIIACIV
jgi:hypothetical protein